MTRDERLEIGDRLDGIMRKFRELETEFKQLTDRFGEIASIGAEVDETEKVKFLKRYS